MKPAPAAIFDLDGTLTDSGPGILTSTRVALERLNALDGIDRPIPPPAELTWIIGPPLLDSFVKLVGADRATTLLALYRERYATVGLFENSVYPGIMQALGGLKAAGFRLFVATSKPETYARRILERFDLAGFFDAIHGAQIDGARAVKSELLAYLLGHERIAASDRVVMIGDRKHDAIGARAVGIPAIGVLWGYGDAEELTAAGADPLIDTPDQIAWAVASVFSRPR